MARDYSTHWEEPGPIVTVGDLMAHLYDYPADMRVAIQGTGCGCCEDPSHGLLKVLVCDGKHCWGNTCEPGSVLQLIAKEDEVNWE